MRAVEVTRYGGPEVLEVTERPEPVVADGEVRVRIRATVANPVDNIVRSGALAKQMPGLQPPFVLGWDFAGTLLDPTDELPEGTEVAGVVPWFALGGAKGTWVDVGAMRPEWMAPIPSGVSLTDAVTVPLNGLTADQSIGLLDVREGQSVLITGAAGAVGGFATQLAVREGAQVIALASASDEEYVRGLGATHFVARGEAEEVAEAVRSIYTSGVDALFDAALIGGSLLPAIRDGGALVTVSAPAVPPSERNIRTAAVGVQPDAQRLRELLVDLSENRLAPSRIAEVAGIEDVAQAQKRVAAGGMRGKVILTL